MSLEFNKKKVRFTLQIRYINKTVYMNRRDQVNARATCETIWFRTG